MDVTALLIGLFCVLVISLLSIISGSTWADDLVVAIFITFGFITSLTGAEVFAKSSAYKSGYNYGVSDASGMIV